VKASSAEIEALGDICQFGTQNDCVLSEILQGQRDLQAGFQTLCRVVKGLHVAVQRMENLLLQGSVK